MNKDQQLAHHILDAVGGIDNVDNIIHCMTRVRLKLTMRHKLIILNLKHRRRARVIQDERLQIVVGPGTVNEVSAEMVKLSGVQLGEDIPIVATRQILKIKHNKTNVNSNKSVNKVK